MFGSSTVPQAVLVPRLRQSLQLMPERVPIASRAWLCGIYIGHAPAGAAQSKAAAWQASAARAALVRPRAGPDCTATGSERDSGGGLVWLFSKAGREAPARGWHAVSFGSLLVDPGV